MCAGGVLKNCGSVVVGIALNILTPVKLASKQFTKQTNKQTSASFVTRIYRFFR